MNGRLLVHSSFVLWPFEMNDAPWFVLNKACYANSLFCRPTAFSAKWKFHTTETFVETTFTLNWSDTNCFWKIMLYFKFLFCHFAKSRRKAANVTTSHSHIRWLSCWSIKVLPGGKLRKEKKTGRKRRTSIKLLDKNRPSYKWWIPTGKLSLLRRHLIDLQSIDGFNMWPFSNVQHRPIAFFKTITAKL